MRFCCLQKSKKKNVTPSFSISTREASTSIFSARDIRRFEVFTTLPTPYINERDPPNRLASWLDPSDDRTNQVWLTLTHTIDWLIKIERGIYLAASFLKWFSWLVRARSVSVRLQNSHFLNRFSTCTTVFSECIDYRDWHRRLRGLIIEKGRLI